MLRIILFFSRETLHRKLPYYTCMQIHPSSCSRMQPMIHWTGRKFPYQTCMQIHPSSCSQMQPMFRWTGQKFPYRLVCKFTPVLALRCNQCFVGLVAPKTTIMAHFEEFFPCTLRQAVPVSGSSDYYCR